MLKITKFLYVQRIARKLRPYTGARAIWSTIGNDPIWNFAKQNTHPRPKVLIATSTGGNFPCSSFESLLGVSLTLRGADVSFLLCDGVLPACQECDYQWISEEEFSNFGPKPLCSSCFSPAKDMLAPLQLPILKYSHYLDGPHRKTAPLSSDDHSLAGALRYYGRGTLPRTSFAKNIYNRYRNASEITSIIISNLVSTERPDVVVFHHGIYIPQGVIGAVLRKLGVRVVNWGVAYRKNRFFFSHDDTYHHTMIEESPLAWEQMLWSEKQELSLLEYLKSRWTGGNDWISFQRGSELNERVISNRLGLDISRPIVGLLTNVIWDAQIHFKNSAFDSMLDWLFRSIEYFLNRRDIQWVIRVHPAEVYGTVPSRQLVLDEIYKKFGELPSHIKLVGPDDAISTYSLMMMCNAALVYGTKTALELACSGLPVIVAGDAWCRGKGFTTDVSSPEQYLKVLENLPLLEQLTQVQITAARKYAYHFFFRRMIPVKALKPMKRFAPYKVSVDSLEELMPGRDHGLDVICDGILNGTPFVYDAPTT